VLVELVPLGRGDVAVFVGGSQQAPLVEERDVVADDVFVEHGDVAAGGGLDVEMAKQRGADVVGRPLLTNPVAKIRWTSCGVKGWWQTPDAGQPARRTGA
jgi:hypothetical protein